MRRLLTAALLSGLLAASSSAQGTAEPGDALYPGFQPGRVVADFQAESGPAWRVRWDHEAGVPRMLFGGNLPLVAPGEVSDATLVAASRAFTDRMAGALGYDSSALVLQRVKLIPLARAGGTDKIAVEFEQVTSGVPTWHGSVNFLWSTDGRLLGVDNQALPHVAQTALAPTVAESAAAAAAAAAFVQETGRAAVSVEPTGYTLYPAAPDPRKAAVRATAAYTWKVSAAFDRVKDGQPVIREYAVAARGTPDVLASWSLVHQADLTGTVKGNGQGALLPNGTPPLGDAPVLQNLKDVRLAATGETNKFSDANGNFTFPNVATPKTVTATFNGEYSRVLNSAGAEASIALSLTPGVPQTFTFNAGLGEQTTAEVNAHIGVERFRDFVLSLDPDDDTFDFQVLSNVNLADVCNAFYDGISINFFLIGGGCPNSAYSTVVYHEEGHWANDLYGSFNGFDGIGEGGADCWAMYIADDPVVAQNFYGLGTFIRTGENMNPFCGDDAPGCYGESHANGEPLMGAIWKVRRNLKTALGNAAGIALSNQYLLGWYQAFDDTELTTIIEEHWLMLDDNDGNLNNGTPNFATIDAAFQEQGFPGFTLPLFSVAHVPVSSPVNSEGPVTVTAQVTEENGTLAGVNVHYTTDGGGSFTTVPMTFLSGSTWSGQIPGQNSPAVVGYYIKAVNALDIGNSFPVKAPKDFIPYDVGTVTVHQFYDFESVGDEGWTHVLVQQQDDWMHGSPNGASTDPPAAYSGTRVWGNDLAPSGFNGAYQPNVNNSLSSPTFNLSGKTDTRLRFRRWLNVEKGIFDLAQVLVNNQVVFTNPSGTDLLDNAWVAQDFDISAIADNNAAVQVKFQLITDPGVEFGGWNVDDFSIVSLGPVAGGLFIPYGLGTPGVSGTPLLVGSGTAAPGGTITLTTTNAKPSAVGTLFIGTSQASIPALGGTFLVGNVIATAGILTNGAGAAVVVGTLPNDPNISGIQINLQHWLLDPAGPAGKAGTNGLQFTIQ
jgi:hypothetical protein